MMDPQPVLCHTPDQTYMCLNHLGSPKKKTGCEPNQPRIVLTKPERGEKNTFSIPTRTTVEMKWGA